MPLPACLASPPVVFEPSYCNFSEDGVDVESVDSSVCLFSCNKCGAGMRKTVNDDLTFMTAGEDNPLNCFQGLLRVTPRHVLFHAVKHLLNVDPYIARPDIL